MGVSKVLGQGEYNRKGTRTSKKEQKGIEEDNSDLESEECAEE